MPRDIPVGNGSLLVAFDAQYRIRDIYYPHVGQENHSEGHPFRFGVWADGQFAWVDADWSRDLRYRPDTLVTEVRLRSNRLGLELLCNDAVDFHLPVYLRKVTIRDLRGNSRDVRLFFHHDFHISGTDVGDTAHYDPATRSVIHYKGERYFLMNVCTPRGCGVETWATGIKELHGAEGTWRDAEDGTLGGNPIAQGAVDSTIGAFSAVPAGGQAEAFYWMAVGRDYHEVSSLNAKVNEKGPQVLLDRTAAYWRLWVTKEPINFADLPSAVVDLFRRSLLVLRTQVDNEGGILAANDSDITPFARDTYSYVWPRDGALVAHALVKAGYRDVPRRFFEFCRRAIKKEGYFLHKYNPDGSLASSWHPWIRDGQPQLPIQEDETGLVLWALWQYHRAFCDVEFIKPLYRPLIVRAGEFLARFRDPASGLPLPSYDLWEERHGILAFTVGAVHGGLAAAAEFAAAFGEGDLAAGFQSAAAEIKAGADAHLFSPEAGRFVRMLTPADGGYRQDPTIDASLYGLFAFGMYDARDPRIEATMKAVEERLWVKTEVGGIARYENDYYHQASQDIATVPGNPWFLCTLWRAQHRIARARDQKELDEALPLLEWVASRALPSGVLAEQVHPYTNAPLSVSPLTWSHAAYVATVLDYLERREQMERCPSCEHPMFRVRG